MKNYKSNKFSKLIPSVFLSLSVSSSVYAANMFEAIEQAITSNPEVLEQLNQKLSRDFEVRQAKSGYLPSIDVIAGYGSESSDNNSTRAGANGSHKNSMNRQEATLVLRQMLFDGFETRSETARQEFRSESANHQLMNLSQQITIDVIVAYVNVLRTQKLVEYAEENVKIHEKIHDQVGLRSSMGADSQGSLSQIAGRLNLAYSNFEAEKNNLKDAKADYERVVGSAPSEALEEAVFDLILPKTFADTLNRAMDNHPSIKAARADVEAVRMQQNTSKSNYYPDLEMELGQDWADNQNGVRGHDNGHYAMLNLRYNIYQGGADKARISKDAHLIMEAQSRMDVTNRTVTKAVDIAWNAYQSSTRRADFLQKYVDSTIETRDAYDQQFQIGERTLLDLLNTENEVFSAHSENIKNQYENLIAKYRVIDSMGMLLNDLELSVLTEAPEMAQK
ncbi:MAG: TolC family outer membrane protein [gamma proteobacterium symbiont of Taylorina sp.]|nr:TolC family outer membrane protein [gamma proteobacterium symbiont of Taylorina sp.]